MKNEKIYGIMVSFLEDFLKKNSYIWKQEFSVSELKDVSRAAISEVWAQDYCPFEMSDFLVKDKKSLVKQYLTSKLRKQTKLYRSFYAFKSFVKKRVQNGKLLEIKHKRFSVSLFPTKKGSLFPGNMHSIYRQIKEQRDSWFSKRQIIMAHFKGRELERWSAAYNESNPSLIGTRLNDILQVEHCKTSQTDAKGYQMLFAAMGWFSFNDSFQLEDSDEAIVGDLGLTDRISALWHKYFQADPMSRSTCFYRLKDFQDYLYRYLKDLSESDRKQVLRDLRKELESYYNHIRELIAQPEKLAA